MNGSNLSVPITSRRGLNPGVSSREHAAIKTGIRRSISAAPHASPQKRGMRCFIQCRKIACKSSKCQRLPKTKIGTSHYSFVFSITSLIELQRGYSRQRCIKMLVLPVIPLFTVCMCGQSGAGGWVRDQRGGGDPRSCPRKEYRRELCPAVRQHGMAPTWCRSSHRPRSNRIFWRWRSCSTPLPAMSHSRSSWSGRYTASTSCCARIRKPCSSRCASRFRLITPGTDQTGTPGGEPDRPETGRARPHRPVGAAGAVLAADQDL
jgi:hypothetical protein